MPSLMSSSTKLAPKRFFQALSAHVIFLSYHPVHITFYQELERCNLARLRRTWTTTVQQLYLCFCSQQTMFLAQQLMLAIKLCNLVKYFVLKLLNTQRLLQLKPKLSACPILSNISQIVSSAVNHFLMPSMLCQLLDLFARELSMLLLSCHVIIENH